MLRVLFASFALIGFGSFVVEAAQANTVRDTEHNFRVAVPGGWTSEPNPTDDIRVIMMPPDHEQTGANCNVVSEAQATSKTMTQAQIDSDIDTQVNEAAWLAMFKSIIFIDSVAIEKVGSERINGHSGHYVIATFASVMPGSPVRLVKIKQELVAIPGEMFFVTCSASQDAYTQREDEFKSVFESFAPLNDTVAAAEPQGVPSLTLYARADFGGVSRVVTRDTPDLALSGWHDPAASMSIAGAGLWQVCDGANYTGSCRLVAGALHESVAVTSARRLPLSHNGFALMLQAGGAQSARSAVRKQ